MQERLKTDSTPLTETLWLHCREQRIGRGGRERGGREGGERGGGGREGEGRERGRGEREGGEREEEGRERGRRETEACFIAEEFTSMYAYNYYT